VRKSMETFGRAGGTARRPCHNEASEALDELFLSGIRSSGYSTSSAALTQV
jgi:hypothetical protein